MAVSQRNTRHVRFPPGLACQHQHLADGVPWHLHLAEVSYSSVPAESQHLAEVQRLAEALHLAEMRRLAEALHLAKARHLAEVPRCVRLHSMAALLAPRIWRRMHSDSVHSFLAPHPRTEFHVGPLPGHLPQRLVNLQARDSELIHHCLPHWNDAFPGPSLGAAQRSLPTDAPKLSRDRLLPPEFARDLLKLRPCVAAATCWPWCHNPLLAAVVEDSAEEGDGLEQKHLQGTRVLGQTSQWRRSLIRSHLRLVVGYQQSASGVLPRRPFDSGG